MVIISFVLLIAFLFSLLPLFKNLNTIEKILAFFISLCAYYILPLEIASLFKELSNLIIIFLIQIIITLTSYFIYRPRFFKPNHETIKKASKDVRNFFKITISKEKFLVVYFFIIVCCYIFLLFLSIKFPQNTSDVLYNHLSRVGYWLNQDSLQPYVGFNNVGSTYPYNNSLLMLWTILLAGNDSYVGIVQFIATIGLGISVYYFGILLGYSKKSCIIAALILLTFPLIVLQSITAQNDILASCFLIISYLFLFDGLKKQKFIFFCLSSLALGLAIGTKQYAFFAIPGYLLLIIVNILKNRKSISKTIISWIITLTISVFLVGSYSYIQNYIYYENFFGKSNVVDNELTKIQIKEISSKLSINSARLFTQFISCEGVPINIENICINWKTKIFSKIFINDSINIEQHKYLLEDNSEFILSEPPILNEESSFYGLLSWILILPSSIIAIFYSLKNKKYVEMTLLLSSFIFFLIISVFKVGWDPYQGRYLVFSVALLMPFTSYLLASDKWYKKIFIIAICSYSIFIFSNTIINNVSRPLLGKTQFITESWNDKTLIERISYRFLPLIKNDISLWGKSRIEVMTYGNSNYRCALDLVEHNISTNNSLGIIANKGYFLDYIFFGESLKRRIVAYPNGINPKDGSNFDTDYILVSPDYFNLVIPYSRLIANNNNWRLLQIIKK